MSASDKPKDTPPAAPSGGAARGGRGGRRGNGRVGNSSKEATKVAPAKTGPSRVLDTTWQEEQGLKGPSFCLWLGGANGLPQQWTFHRPVGVTNLGESEWVATPTSEIPLLLSRKKSEALSAWERKRDLAARQRVLAAGIGRKVKIDGEVSEEIWSFDGAAPIGPTIKTCMAAAKAAGKPESTWLEHADQPVRAAELAFKEALKSATPNKAWFEANPKPAFETRGGPLGDRPQEKVWYLSGTTLGQAKDNVLGMVTGAFRPRRRSPTPEESAPAAPALAGAENGG